jgi:thymidylate synthase
MKLLIVTNDRAKPGPRKPFTVIMEDIFSERVVKHVLNDYAEICNGCDKDCDHCRDKYPVLYPVDFKEQTSVILLPAELPYYVDDADDFLPDSLPEHDVLIAIHIHEDLLMALPSRSKRAGGKAVIVPSEDPEWVSAWLRGRVRKICDSLDMESAFPKPFCSLTEEPDKPVIAKFIRSFRIGRPRIKLKVQDGRIIESQVIISAPCGCTYYVARNLLNKEVNEELNVEVTAKYWHSYPCVASMDVDRELGDTPLHKGGYMHYEAVADAVEEEVPDVKVKKDKVQITGKK